MFPTLTAQTRKEILCNLWILFPRRGDHLSPALLQLVWPRFSQVWFQVHRPAVTVRGESMFTITSRRRYTSIIKGHIRKLMAEAVRLLEPVAALRAVSEVMAVAEVKGAVRPGGA